MKTLVDLLHYVRQFENNGFYFVYSREEERFISYHDFFEQACIVANALKRKGIKEQDELILSIDDMQCFLTTFWACILEGIKVIPSKLSEDTLEQFQNVWEICENPKVITDCTNATKLWDVLRDDVVIIYSELELENDSNYVIPTYCPNEDDLAYIQFSSGSSSDAKGVEITHKMAITWQKLFKMNYPEITTGGALSWVPLYHNYGLIAGCITPMYFVYDQIFIPVERFFNDPVLWGICIDRYRPAQAITTNFALNYFLKKYELEENQVHHWDFSSLQNIFIGAEPISTSLCKEFMEKTKPYGIYTEALSPGYGLAEATLTVAMTPHGEKQRIKYVDTESLNIGGHVIEVSEDEPNHSVFMATGQQNEITRLKIFDLNEQELGEKQVGLICLQGDCVFKQYYRNHHNDSFMSNGWFNTGDLGFLDQGWLYVTGRYKNMFLYNGKNYYSNDIEEFISNENELFREMIYIVGYRKCAQDVNDSVICFVVYDEDWEERMSAIHDVVEKIHSSLGIYISEVVPIHEVPKTTSGKVKRYTLKENYEDGLYAKEIAAYQELSHELAASSEEEIEDVELFLEGALIEIVGESIDIGANFIEMGLESKDISKFFIKIDQHFPNLITISELFEFQNVEQLAAHINEKIFELERNEAEDD